MTDALAWSTSAVNCYTRRFHGLIAVVTCGCVEAYFIASAELFDRLPESESARILPELKQRDALGITGFTLPTMYRWIRSDAGRVMMMHPLMHGHYPESGSGRAAITKEVRDECTMARTLRFRRAADDRRLP